MGAAEGITGAVAALAIVQQAAATASAAAGSAGFASIASAAGSIGATAGGLASGFGGAAAAAGPYAPAVAAAIYLGVTWRKILQGQKSLAACRERAAMRMVEASMKSAVGFPFVTLNDSKTRGDPDCYHKGLKTKDRLDGRVSFRIPGTVRREDVLPRASDDAIDWWLGRRRRALDQVVILPWLGPYAWQSDSYARRGELTNYAPAASVAVLSYTARLMDERPPWVREAAAIMLGHLLQPHAYGRSIYSNTADKQRGELLTILRGYLGAP